MIYRSAKLLVGLVLFATGVAMTVQAELGLAPWDVLHSAVSRLSGLGFGTAAVITSAVVLLLAWVLGVRPGVGTVVNAIVFGTVIEVLLRLGMAEGADRWPLAGRLLLLVGGLAVIAVGTALYIGAHLGSGPRDSLMLAVHRRFRAPLYLARGVVEGCVFVLGWAFGGSVGLGTVVSVVLIGPMVQLAFAVLRQAPLPPVTSAPAGTT